MHIFLYKHSTNLQFMLVGLGFLSFFLSTLSWAIVDLKSIQHKYFTVKNIDCKGNFRYKIYFDCTWVWLHLKIGSQKFLDILTKHKDSAPIVKKGQKSWNFVSQE